MSNASEERNVKIVQALFAATGGGDWAAAEAMLSEDFFVTEAPSNVFAGVYRGRSALKSLFERVIGAAGVTKLDVKQLCVGGDFVAALIDMTLAGPPEVLVTLTEVFRFRDDKVCEIKPYYFDAQPLAEAVARNQKRG